MTKKNTDISDIVDIANSDGTVAASLINDFVFIHA